jgi:hypothetical protein
MDVELDTSMRRTKGSVYPIKGQIMTPTLRRAALAAALAITLTAGNVAPGPLAREKIPESAAAFTDADLLLALVYGSGALAHSLGTELRADDFGSPELASDYARSVEDDAAVLLREEKEALKPVLGSLRSDSAFQVNGAFSALQPIVHRHFEKSLREEGVALEQLDGEAPGTRCGAAVVCIAYAAAAVHNVAVATAAAAVVVAVALWCGAWKWCSSSSSGANEMTQAAREQLVVTVRDALRAHA